MILAILGKSHYLLYTLVSAIHPRMLTTFDEELKPLPVSVRVGQAVDVVGQAGHPKTITGSQTHTTPVLIGYGERAELATDECAYPSFVFCVVANISIRYSRIFNLGGLCYTEEESCL
mgnify:CR=1 FL=1